LHHGGIGAIGEGTHRIGHPIGKFAVENHGIGRAGFERAPRPALERDVAQHRV
jgi:hypothetical protein